MTILRPSVFLAGLLLQAFQSVADSSTHSPSKAGNRPNFLIILSDDQRYDTMDFMPHTKARVFDQGVTFPNAYVTTPVCCPSRASILTGMYAHNHGVRRNADTLQKRTFIDRLKKRRYYTGQVGKYLNSWDGSARPEFDFWVAFSGGGHRYFDPKLNVNGTWTDHKGYITYILRDYALEFLRRAGQEEKPFVLLFSPNAPHFPSGTGELSRVLDFHRPPDPDPAPGDETLYANLAPHRPPSFNQSDVSGKPRWLQSRLSLTSDLIAMIDTFRRRQLQTLKALDRAIESLLDELSRQGRLEETVVIYLSDNGYFWGEHRIPLGKGFVYEESSRVPFAVRYSRLVPKPRVDARLVANIDIAPTIYELAGISIPPKVDGRSLVPLLKRNQEQANSPIDWREELPLEYWPDLEDATQGQARYAAVHTSRYVYVETEGDRSELYDLTADPHQLKNQVKNPAYASVVTDLKARLKRARPEARGASRR